MKEILRRILRLDDAGRVIGSEVEHLVDREDGRIEELRIASVRQCPACRHWIEKLDDIRPACVRCRRPTCVHCISLCAACACPLCGHCRVGFPEKGLSVCPRCLARLDRRLAQDDQLTQGKLNFERLMSVFSAEAKLLELVGRDGGSLVALVAQIQKLRLLRNLAQLEQQLRQEHDHGRRLLP